MVVACGSDVSLSTTTTVPLPAPVAANAPAAPSSVAWQAMIGPDPVIVGGVVVARTEGGVQEFDAHTGEPRWRWTNARQPVSLEFVVADATVFAVLGHDVGQAPAMVAPIAAELDALDLSTGRFLWSHPITGTTQSPGLTAAGPVIAMVDNSIPGAVLGLDPRTGRRRWIDPAPTTCPAPGSTGLVAGTYLSGDGNELAVGRRCGLIQGLDPNTGQPRWSSRAGDGTTIFTIPPGSNLLVVSAQPVTGTGQPTTPSQHWSVPDTPTGLATQQAVALNVNTGQLDWQESGMPSGATAAGDATALCMIDRSGYECRRTTTGALVFAPTTWPQKPVGPFGDSNAVTQADDIVYQLDIDSAGTERVLVRSATTGSVTATERLDVGQVPAEGSATQTGLITAANGLLLIRRSDVPGFPVLAMTDPR
jgi:outer membrane protein assembly factor BamB